MIVCLCKSGAVSGLFFAAGAVSGLLVQIIFYGRDEGDLGLGEAIILTGKSRDSGFGTGS